MSKDKRLMINYDEQLDFVDIYSADDFGITYGNGLGCHKLKCIYGDGTDIYNEIKDILDDISEKIRRLYILAPIEDLNDNEQCVSIKNIQLLLIVYAGYIEDKGDNCWQDKEFKKIADKYNFNKENLYKGFEHLTC
ncbi:MAG: hypothetical protein LIR50_04875 [Bacillota bacterium]|nr:hypothetical protein [Bacillota bacterium]